ncbi:MAG: carbohydrate ABC transporter permease [Chloroflexota bacterium]|nr:carbohydrate ABC transporter permease [Chloroflexota bacterium]
MVGGSQVVFLVKHMFLALILLIVMFPVYWLVSMSVKSTRELSARPPTMIVQNFALQNFYNVLVTQNFFQYAWNSVQVAVIATLIATVAGSLCAYGLSRFSLPKNLNYQLLFTVLTVRMFPPSVTVIPIYILFNREILGFKLYDTQFGLGLVHAFLDVPLVVWIMLGFFREIPRDIEEAALVDGDSWLGAFRRQILPLAAPGLAATAILVAISSWNEFLFALILTQRSQTLPIAVAGQITQFDILYGNLMAGGVFAAIPVVVFALLVQRHIIRGLALGGVTG